MERIRLTPDDIRFPSGSCRHLGEEAPEGITILGNTDLLQHSTIALFCSKRCPGNLVLRTHDLAQSLREAAVTVISGFHSPVERECLTVLLRGTNPIVICMARSLDKMRIPSSYRIPLKDRRLLLISSFDGTPQRPTAKTAEYRNRFVAALADKVIVGYAEVGGKTAGLCREVIAWGKPLYTFDDEANWNLMELGANPMAPGCQPLFLR